MSGNKSGYTPGIIPGRGRDGMNDIHRLARRLAEERELESRNARASTYLSLIHISEPTRPY